MHVHICTLSVSMHIETVSHIQSYHYSLRKTGLSGKKKKKNKLPSQAKKKKKRKHIELIDVHGSPLSSTSSALEQGGKRMKARATSTEIKAYFFVL